MHYGRKSLYLLRKKVNVLVILLSISGLTISNKPCCEVESGMVTCVPLCTPCSNRTEYLFWDMLHPTEAVNFFIAGKAYNAQSQSDSYPIDIRHLAEL